MRYFSGVAINSGQNILFENGHCHGGHGLFIGSARGRTNNTVKNVTFTDIVVENSQQSVRIKAFSGANETIDHITYRSIKMKGGDDYGILVDQLYSGVDGQPKKKEQKK